MPHLPRMRVAKCTVVHRIDLLQLPGIQSALRSRNHLVGWTCLVKAEPSVDVLRVRNGGERLVLRRAQSSIPL